MSLNKKEQTELETLKLDLAMERAMRRSQPVAKDLPPPDSSGELSKGWDYSAYGNGEVRQHCSSSVFNGSGWEKTPYQNSRRLFSTELLALQALRHELAEGYAKNLARIDALIDQAAKQ